MLAKCHGLHDDLKAARRDVCYAAWQATSVCYDTTLACRLLCEQLTYYVIALLTPAVPVAFMMASVC